MPPPPLTSYSATPPVLNNNWQQPPLHHQQAPAPASTLPPEVAARIEANRLRALEIRRQRESEARAPNIQLQPLSSMPPQQPYQQQYQQLPMSIPQNPYQAYPPGNSYTTTNPPQFQSYPTPPMQSHAPQLRTGGGSVVGVSRAQLDRADQILNNK